MNNFRCFFYSNNNKEFEITSVHAIIKIPLQKPSVYKSWQQFSYLKIIYRKLLPFQSTFSWKYNSISIARKTRVDPYKLKKSHEQMNLLHGWPEHPSIWKMKLLFISLLYLPLKVMHFQILYSLLFTKVILWCAFTVFVVVQRSQLNENIFL